MKKFLLLFILLITHYSFSQKITVSGIVSDVDGALPGVSVIIKGTTIGTETDFNGKYKIEASLGDVLVFLYLGFESKEIIIDEEKKIVKNKLTQNIKLTEEILVCFLHNYKSLIVGPYSGLKNTEKGFIIEKVFNSFGSFGEYYRLTFGTQYGNRDRQYRASIGIITAIYTYPYVADFALNYENIQLRSKSLNFQSFVIENKSSFSTYEKKWPNIFLGIGISQFNNKDNKVGYEFGLGHHLFERFEIFSKVFLWQAFEQLKIGFNWTYDNFFLSYEYNGLQSYKEHNISLGYRFWL